MINPTLDGVEHINIYSRGHTELGRMLSNLYDRDFIVDGYGSFRSMEGFWHYYLTGCQFDEFRLASGHGSKRIGKTVKEFRIDTRGNMELEHQEVILSAIRCKLRQHRDIRILLAESTLPFEHYYYYGQPDKATVINQPQYGWMLAEFDRLRKLLQERK